MRRTLTITLITWLLPYASYAMGPDPGGHTGAGVTSTTTKTDRPEVDTAVAKTAPGNPDTKKRTKPEELDGEIKPQGQK